MPRDYSFRAMTDDDLPLAAEVFASTRREEVALTHWPQAQQDAFLQQQHEAQHRHYRKHYPGAQWLVIERDGQPIGRLYRIDWPHEIHVIDISLLPEARGAGIGEAILSTILDEGRTAGKPVSIYVEKHNRARSLYARLGFTVTSEQGIYDRMEWRAESSAQLR